MGPQKIICILFLLFQVKHFVIDFLWQPPFEWKNKGTYGHLGGIRHSFKHGLATLYILAFTPLQTAPTASLASLAVGLALFDFIAHYHIDWAKMNVNARFKLTPINESFWIMLGLDQFLHQITMLAIVYLFMGAR